MHFRAYYREGSLEMQCSCRIVDGQAYYREGSLETAAHMEGA